MFAIRENDSKRWYNGMDDRYTPPRPKLSRRKMTVWNTSAEAKLNIPRDPDHVYEICRISFRVEEFYNGIR